MKRAELEAAVTKVLKERESQSKEYEKTKSRFDELVKEFEKFINSAFSDLFPFTAGYEWRRNENNILFKWELVKVENGKGTEGNPILFVPPMYCYTGAYYSKQGKKYLCISKGYCSSLEDTEHFEEV